MAGNRLPQDWRINVRVKTRIMPEDEQADRTIRALSRFLDGGLNALIKQAVAETILKAYAARFELGYGRFSRMIPGFQGGAKGGPRGHRREYIIGDIIEARKEEAQALRDLAAARNSGAIGAIEDATKRVENVRDTIGRMTDSYLGKGPVQPQKPFRGDGFAGQVAKVLDELSNAKKVDPYHGKNITFRFGSIARLDKIPTTTRFTKSKHNILWRQLEFGSGIFAKPNIRKGSGLPKNPSGDGSWYFGTNLILGNEPGNFLRKATGLAYDTDALLFQDHLAKAIRKALQG